MRVLLLAAFAATALYGQAPQSQWFSQPNWHFGQTIQLDQAAPAQPQTEAPKSSVMRIWRKGSVIVMTRPTTACAIPLLNAGAAPSFNGDPNMVLPNSAPSAESKPAESEPAESKPADKGIIKPMPVCPKR